MVNVLFHSLTHLRIEWFYFIKKIFITYKVKRELKL